MKTSIQADWIDDNLKNSLWNALEICYWETMKFTDLAPIAQGYYLSQNKEHQVLCRSIWADFFKKPLDTLDDEWDGPNGVKSKLRNFFFWKADWHEVYDFIEFVASSYPDEVVNDRFVAICNDALERELSAYRFVGGIISPVVSEVEIGELEEALETPFTPARTHLKRALEFLADREQPDYRNSIKESISSVEAVARVITGEDKATLGAALKKLSDVHPALASAFQKLYGYTSDEAGIRHSLIEAAEVGFDEAKFMLVACSAFVNYVAGRASAQGLS